MKINILLPFKEKFDEDKASSVSITVRNNLLYSNYLNQIKIFGQNTENPLFKNNFVGLKYSILSLKSKNKFLAHEMLKIIAKDSDKNQLIEIHNRPYLVDKIAKGNKFPISCFFHNNPLSMRGSKSIKDRENILNKCAAVFCVSQFIKSKFLKDIKENFEKVHVLHNGVERKLTRFPKKKKEVFFVGRLISEKSVHFYVEAVKTLAHKHSEWDFGLIGSYKLGDNKKRDFYSNTIEKKLGLLVIKPNFIDFKIKNLLKKK